MCSQKGEVGGVAGSELAMMVRTLARGEPCPRLAADDAVAVCDGVRVMWGDGPHARRRTTRGPAAGRVPVAWGE